MPADRSRARKLLIGTFLIFFLPIVGAWLLNVFAPDWRPFGSVNHGTLVRPVRPVSAAGLAPLRAATLQADYLTGRWTLVHVLTGPCARDCVDALERTRQVHLALGDDMSRVQRLLVVTDSQLAQNLALSEELPVALANGTWLESFAFADDGEQRSLGVYLVDPQGYLMMRYPQSVKQPALLADLERLLKVSKIG